MGARSGGTVIGRDGVIASACALAVVMIDFMRLTTPHAQSSLAVMMILWAVAGVLMVALCRFEMPDVVRMPLIVGLIGGSIALGATGGALGAKVVGDPASDDSELAVALGHRTGHGANDLQPTGDAATGVVGARVAMAAAPAGDDGWAQTINERLDGKLGGSAAGNFEIGGDVTGHDDDSAAPRQVSVAWQITSGGATARCGVTTVTAAPAAKDGGALVDQLAGSFNEAIARSLALGHAACA